MNSLQQEEKLQHQTPVDERTRQRIQMLMRIVGTMLPLVGNCALVWFSLEHNYSYAWVVMMYLVPSFGACLLSFIGAILFRSWWAVLIVPIASLVGVTMGVFNPYSPVAFNLQTIVFNMQVWVYKVWAQIITIEMGPVILGTICGTIVGFAFSKWWEARQLLNWALKAMAQQER